jgi:uncharacterized protein
MYKERSYRRWVNSADLVTFEVKERETDLYISADSDLTSQARAAVLGYRRDIEEYILKHREFFTSLEPVDVGEDAPKIVSAMADAARKAGVGPMASIAGAVAEFVGRDLLPLSGEIMIENGGDIFLRTLKPRTMGIFAGEDSPFTGKLAIEIAPHKDGLGVCTSSGTVSHSLSFGNADVSLIISNNAALADAMATAVGNLVRSKDDIEKAVAFARSIDGVKGVLLIAGEKIGTWGQIKLI